MLLPPLCCCCRLVASGSLLKTSPRATISCFYCDTRRLILGSRSVHAQSVSKAVFNGYGNMAVSGSKDQTVKLWDMFSGCCIKTISGNFSEVTHHRLYAHYVLVHIMIVLSMFTLIAHSFPHLW